MLRPDKLGAVLEIAAKVGISIEYVETNSSWFQDIDSAKDLLTQLSGKGLHTLLVSISPFHNEQIPFLVELYNNGIQGLFEFAKGNYAFSPQRNDYINKCDLCTEIRTHLVKNDYNETNEFKPKEFYLRS